MYGYEYINPIIIQAKNVPNQAEFLILLASCHIVPYACRLTK